MKCPSCGVEASGKFCFSCGAPLKSQQCPSCGAAAAPGSKFCTSCGKALPGKAPGAGPPRPGNRGAARSRAGGRPTIASQMVETAEAAGGPGNLAWWVAGGLLVVLIIALGYPILRRSSGVGGAGVGDVPPGMGGSGAASGLVDLSTMTLDEQGTRLFNRVMTSNSAGDTADVAFFLPKALVIYEQINPTDPDGLYHYALLYLVGEDYQAALDKAKEGLAESPDYLLLLAAGAEASVGLGDTVAARDYYAHLLQVYDSEMALMRPGYDHHQRILPAYREEAQAFLDGR